MSVRICSTNPDSQYYPCTEATPEQKHREEYEQHHKGKREQLRDRRMKQLGLEPHNMARNCLGRVGFRRLGPDGTVQPGKIGEIDLFLDKTDVPSHEEYFKAISEMEAATHSSETQYFETSFCG
jgi:hypothetical protein